MRIGSARNHTLDINSHCYNTYTKSSSSCHPLSSAFIEYFNRKITNTKYYLYSLYMYTYADVVGKERRRIYASFHRLTSLLGLIGTRERKKVLGNGASEANDKSVLENMCRYSFYIVEGVVEYNSRLTYIVDCFFDELTVFCNCACDITK